MGDGALNGPFVRKHDWVSPLKILAYLAQSAQKNATILAFMSGTDHPLARWSYVAYDPLIIIEQAAGASPFSGLALPKLPDVDFADVPKEDQPAFLGGWAGGLSYGLGHSFEKFARPAPHNGGTDPWPDMVLGLFDRLFAFDHHKKRVFTIARGLVLPIDRPISAAVQDDDKACQTQEILARQLDGARDFIVEGPFENRMVDKTLPFSGPDDEAIMARVAKTITYIKAGDIYQANISRRKSGTLAQNDSPFALFSRLYQAHPAPFCAYFSITTNDGIKRALISQSPERFIQLGADGRAETRPIKGTRARGATQILDDLAAANLVNSAKERAENLMIVDLMRNDLARVCNAGSVRVPRLFGLESFSNLHHLVSDVVGQLANGKNGFDLLAATFPPGSITGAPKVRAMEIISELEQESRDMWCGALMWMGFDGAMDSSVLIRTAIAQLPQMDGRWQVDLRAGAGIVADSNPQEEVAEMNLKMGSLLAAIDGAGGNNGPN